MKIRFWLNIKFDSTLPPPTHIAIVRGCVCVWLFVCVLNAFYLSFVFVINSFVLGKHSLSVIMIMFSSLISRLSWLFCKIWKYLLFFMDREIYTNDRRDESINECHLKSIFEKISWLTSIDFGRKVSSHLAGSFSFDKFYCFETVAFCNTLTPCWIGSVLYVSGMIQPILLDFELGHSEGTWTVTNKY